MLPACLDSIRRQTCTRSLTVCIDNSADPGFGNALSSRYPWVERVTPEKGLCYSRSLNLGISQGSAEFVLCMNDDLILEPDYLERALSGFSMDEKIGMVSGKILRLDAVTLDSTGLFLSHSRTAVERGYGKKDRGQFQRPGYCFGVTGAAGFYRRAMLEDVRIGPGVYFDPEYRYFYEDLDVAWRAQRRGWKGYYLPGAVARHLRGGSLRRKSGIGRAFARRFLDEHLNAELIKNRYLTMIRNDRLSGILKNFLFIIGYELASWAYILFFRPGVVRILYLERASLKKAWALRRREA